MRNEAFEAAQTRHGNYSTSTTHEREQEEASRPRTPPKISPLPNLDNVISRLRSQLADMQTSRMGKLHEMEALQREKIRIGEEEVRIQKALRETAEKFEQLRREKGIAGQTVSGLVLDHPAGVCVRAKTFLPRKKILTFSQLRGHRKQKS